MIVSAEDFSAEAPVLAVSETKDLLSEADQGLESGVGSESSSKKEAECGQTEALDDAHPSRDEK